MARRRAAVVTLSNDRISRSIHYFRSHKVMLDADIAELYNVSTKALVQAVKRNRARFPPDFMFQLTRSEYTDLKSQSVTSRSWGGRRTRPYAFTEQGIAMLSSVLRSARAVQVNIAIMRVFARLRQTADSHADLSRRLDVLERRYDGQFAAVFTAMRQLIGPPVKPQRRIGF